MHPRAPYHQRSGAEGRLFVEGCRNLTALPADLKMFSIEVAGSSISSLPESGRNIPIYWRGVRVSPRVAFDPESFSREQILAPRNAEVRRVLIERLGLDRLMEIVQPDVADEDTDRGGLRRLLQVRLPSEREPLVCLECRCPSTGRIFFLRVPPTITSCRAAAAWVAGFDDPEDYHPTVES